MRFWTLGTSAAVPTRDRDNLSILVGAPGESYLLDCSGSPVHRMCRVGAELSDLAAVIITHRHPDHLCGLPCLLHSMMVRPTRNRPLPVYAPPEALQVISHLLAALWHEYTYTQLIDLQPVSLAPNHLLLESERVQILVSPVVHGPETVAVKLVEKGTGASLVYSSDTEPCQSLVDLATGVDDLIHDSTFCEVEGLDSAIPGHSSARQAGLIAKRAGVNRLILIHFGLSEADTERYVDQALQVYDGEVIAASDFQEFLCGAGAR